LKEELLRRIKNGTCEVLGLGVSNLPLCRWLADKGAKVIGRDKKSEDELGATAKELKSLGVKLITGEAYLDGIGENAPENTLVFRSPGIRPDVKGIVEALNKGALLTSEMELFFELTPTKIIGITGSDGKTTTTTLIGELLRLQFMSDRTGRRVYVGGNIGEPLLPHVDEMKADDVAVVELSSFQLMTMKRSVNRAVITNITPNHLDWHTGMDEYADAKANICKYIPCEHITLNAENEGTASIGEHTALPVTYFSSKRADFEKTGTAIYEREGDIVFFDGKTEEKIISVSSIKLPGRHNVENYMAAISATWGIVSKEVIKEIAETFNGVEHRCELVRVYNGSKYYNSSIDSSPTRTAAALASFSQKVIIICGGYDKNIPFEPLADALCEKAKTVVLTGATAGKIKDAIIRCPAYSDGLFDIIEESDFEEAVKAAANSARPGDIVILSPACASFDAFKNFAERGRKFKEIIKNME